VLVLFRPSQILDTLYWVDPVLFVVRVRDARPQPYREEAVTEDERLVGFRRVYRASGVRSQRVALTPSLTLARMWQNAPSVSAPWRWLRSMVEPERRVVRSVSARTYDERAPGEVMDCMHDLMQLWRSPDTTIRRVVSPLPGVWADPTATVPESVRTVGPVWVGAGRQLAENSLIVGPALLWDEPSTRPEAAHIDMLDVEPTTITAPDRSRPRLTQVPGKRAFDIVFALLALAVVLPFFPLVAIAILIDDGWPVFYAHRRQTLGGREFPCFKFRSMRKQAEKIKATIRTANQADGPQFFMKDDPRVTRVGRFIRKTQIDELPQFFNVLLGHMSVVGPRPSPHSENQYCPAWREARLSVRPGVTGLWQVSRTRQAGLDFQEWIRFDLEYVEKASWALDLDILVKTVAVVASAGTR